MNQKKNKIDQIAKMAIFVALGVVLYKFPKFPLPFFPSFLEIQFSNLPLLIGGFLLGPISGAIMVLAKTLLTLPFTTTACVGELVDFLISMGCVLSSSLLYKKFHTKKGAFLSLILCIFLWVGIACLCNGTFLIPFYAKLYAGYGGMDMIIGACQKVIPSITKENFMWKYLLLAVVPFNLLLSTIVSLVTFFVYKKISFLFQKDFIHQKKKKD